MGIDGERIKKYAPQIKKHILDSIEGTDELNRMWGDVYTQAGKSTLGIEADIARVELAEIDLIDGRTEKAYKFIQDKQRKSIRHQDNMQALQMESEIAEIEQLANHDFRMQRLENKLPLAQIKADKDYQNARLDHVLQFGESSQTKLIPKKEYTGRNVLSRVIDFFSGK